ncbi:hypothetical protein BDV95DRAFT_598249 [Massariosphaeria phaeospora]|uniref:F-box domain-containing protein n=1 Tax=Massariosphaeria phaeospora TaxID=100035 RepID=A0A7C8I089_9PLEO|nr:hypothetical protein BDV95DRAFT_598249 [Massariosphaeria phaeospora]
MSLKRPRGSTETAEMPHCALLRYQEALMKIEASPESSLLTTTPPSDATPNINPATASITDPKDPENFLRRCSGHNKKTKVRCSAIIGRNSTHAKNYDPTFLPTCYTHRDQQSYAGWCQFKATAAGRCGRLFRWTPPYLALCSDHRDQPDNPCYFMKLPLELRLEIFSYLLPTEPIGSSTFSSHRDPALHRCNFGMMAAPIPPHPPSLNVGSVFPMPLLDLLLVNRQVYAEAKDLFYSIVPFQIDVRKDGTFMCGRRLLEPTRPDGTPHYVFDDAQELTRKFIRSFKFELVKNYNVDILVENCKDVNPGMQPNNMINWDEEVEIYDIRDYIGVVISGILIKARNLCKLHVRLCFSKFTWPEETLLANINRLLAPFEGLRNVRQPRLCGIYEGTTNSIMMSLPQPPRRVDDQRIPSLAICSVPYFPIQRLLLGPGNPSYDKYKSRWERWMSQSTRAPPIKSPIRIMFTHFKKYYAKLSGIVPDVTVRFGKQAFLHRARVARENEDVEAFRHLRNELIHYWLKYLEQEELKKKEMDIMLSKMLDTDVYPADDDEQVIRRRSSSSHPDSPVELDKVKMVAEGIPMQGNPSQRNPYGTAMSLQEYQQLTHQSQQQHGYRVAQMNQPGSSDQHLQHQQQAQSRAQQTMLRQQMMAQQQAIALQHARQFQAPTSSYTEAEQWSVNTPSQRPFVPANSQSQSNTMPTTGMRGTNAMESQVWYTYPPGLPSSSSSSSSSASSSPQSALQSPSTDVDMSDRPNAWNEFKPETVIPETRVHQGFPSASPTSRPSSASTFTDQGFATDSTAVGSVTPPWSHPQWPNVVQMQHQHAPQMQHPTQMQQHPPQSQHNPQNQHPHNSTYQSTPAANTISAPQLQPRPQPSYTTTKTHPRKRARTSQPPWTQHHPNFNNPPSPHQTGIQIQINENGDEIMVIDDDSDGSWECGRGDGRAGYVGKGKGRAGEG